MSHSTIYLTTNTCNSVTKKLNSKPSSFDINIKLDFCRYNNNTWKWKIINGIILGFKHARIKLFVNCHFNVNYEVVHFNNKFTIICVYSLFFLFGTIVYNLCTHIHITLCACILPCNYLFITYNLLYKGLKIAAIW